MTDNSWHAERGSFFQNIRRGLMLRRAAGAGEAGSGAAGSGTAGSGAGSSDDLSAGDPVTSRRAALDSESSARSDASRSRSGSTRRRKGGPARFARDIIIIFLAALLISFLIKTFLVRSFYIPSASMENTLQINDRIIVNELAPKVVPLKRGDVVVFRDPGGWLGAADQVSSTTGNPVVDGFQWLLTQVGLGTQDSNDHLIKRVIGLPGDTVTCCNDFGQTSVNGVPLDEPYVKTPAAQQRPQTFTVTVPAGSLWVEGDNRDNSGDSRAHQGTPSKGFVPESDVVGRAVVITWPSSHWTWLDDYPQVFRGTDRASR